MNEALTINKLALPKTFTKFKHIDWNDIDQHNFYERIKSRTSLTRKEVISKIVKVIDSTTFHSDGPYVLDFTKSHFYVTVFVKLETKEIQIKTILSYDMKLRPKDRKISINEAEKLLNLDLSEFYSDGFVSSYFGSLLIEESVDRETLEVFIDVLDVEPPSWRY